MIGIDTSRWNRVPLGDAIELAYGKSLAEKTRRHGRFPVYGSNGVVGWHDEPLVSHPTIIVGRKGAAGAVHVAPGPSFPIDTTYYVRSRPGYEFDLQFLAHALRAMNLDRLKIVVAVPGLNREHAYRELIPCPPIEEQRRIVDLLSRAENIVRMRREAEAKAKAIIPALFVNMFGDPGTNPKGWETPSVASVGRVQLGRQRAPKYQSGVFTRPYMRVANVHENRIDTSDVLSMDFDDRDYEQYRLKWGDILLNEGQSIELVGRPAMWRDEIENCCFQNTLVRFQPERDKMTPQFALTMLLMCYHDGALAKISSKTSNVAHLGAARFAKMSVICPPIDPQLEFSRHFDKGCDMEASQRVSVAVAESAFESLLAGVFQQ